MPATQSVDPSVQVALIGGFVAIVVLLLGMWNQNRTHGKTLTKVEHGINHVDEEPPAGDGPVTLGQLVKSIDGKVGAQGDTIHQLGSRVDTIATDLNRVEEKVDDVKAGCVNGTSHEPPPLMGASRRITR